MKLTVSSYSFSQALRDGRVKSMADLPALAKEMGFEGLEIAASSDAVLAEAKAVRKAADDAGIPISSVCVDADFLTNDVKAQADRLRPIVDATALLGASMLRHDATVGFPEAYHGMRTFQAVLPRIAEGCRMVTEYAAGLGVRTMVENHGRFCQDSHRVEALIHTVDHPNYGALIDMGNFLCADEDPAHAVSALAPLAFHVHAKDFFFQKAAGAPGAGWFQTRGANWLRGTIVGHGIVPVRQCLAIMKNAGYNGWLSLEFEGIEDCMLGIEDGKRNLDHMLAELG